jgi:hypothetical protein
VFAGAVESNISDEWRVPSCACDHSVVTFSNVPTDPKLAALVNATVRVGSATGAIVLAPRRRVVVTAAHVVEREESPIVRVRGATFSFDASVLATSHESDIAILSDHINVPSDFGLQLVDAASPVALGDDVWTAGFPTGWNQSVPVTARGLVAAVSDEVWINADGTWGNSGGAVVRMCDEQPAIAGIVLGRAGAVGKALRNLRDDLRKVTTRDVYSEQAFERFVDDSLRSIDATGDQLVAKEVPADGDRITQLATVVGNILGLQKSMVETVRGITQVMHANTKRSMGIIAETATMLVDLVDDHFRTGYVRIGTADDVRAVLGD